MRATRCPNQGSLIDSVPFATTHWPFTRAAVTSRGTLEPHQGSLGGIKGRFEMTKRPRCCTGCLALKPALSRLDSRQQQSSPNAKLPASPSFIRNTRGEYTLAQPDLSPIPRHPLHSPYGDAPELSAAAQPAAHGRNPDGPRFALRRCRREPPRVAGRNWSARSEREAEDSPRNQGDEYGRRTALNAFERGSTASSPFCPIVLSLICDRIARFRVSTARTPCRPPLPS